MGAPEEMVTFLRTELSAHKNPKKAREMAAYMKTEMPFYGVQKPDRVPILRELKRRWVPGSHSEYEAMVRTLWQQPHREEKYAALHVARVHKAFITPDALELYEDLIRQGAWWDFVDEVSVNLVGPVWLKHRAAVTPLADAWIEDDDRWIRRSAIIGQLKHKADTDRRRLFRYSRDHAQEKEFFIRKAIGWALREYAKTAPEAVRDFLVQHRAKWSGLTLSEAARGLRKAGYEV